MFRTRLSTPVAKSAMQDPLELQIKEHTAPADSSLQGHHTKRETDLPIKPSAQPGTRIPEFPWRDYIKKYVNTGSLSEDFLNASVRLVRKVTAKMPPSLYSPTGRWWEADELPPATSGYCWNNAIDGHKTIVVDVLADQIEKGHLDTLFHAGKTNVQIHEHLMYAVKWHLGGIARKHGAHRKELFVRLRQALKQNRKFHDFGSSLGWGLVEWKKRDWEVASGERLRERLDLISVPCPASFRRRVRIKRKNETTIIPNKSELSEFASAFLHRFGYPLPLVALVDAAQVHFGVAETRIVEMPTMSDGETDDEAPIEYEDHHADSHVLILQNRGKIKKFVGELARRDLLLLKEVFLNGKGQGELVHRGYSKSSVSNDFRRIGKLLRDMKLDPEAMYIVKTIFEEEISELALGNEKINYENSLENSRISSRKAAVCHKEKVGKNQ